MRNHKIAIQGALASYHDLAAKKFYGEEIDILECLTFEDTCRKVQLNEADYAVMAIENSTVGSILSNYNLIEKYALRIIGELYVKIQFHLLALPGTKLKDIEFIHSHQMAISQCQQFLSEHSFIKAVESNDTATCAREIQTKNLINTAAIANEITARTYGLEIVQSNIESNTKNYTRFLILSKGKDVIEQPNKASISFIAKNTPNTLTKALNAIGAYEINLTKIQSVPIIGNPNEYSFHIDLEWDAYEDYQNAIKHLSIHCQKLHILGEYKKAVLMNHQLN
jgi:prephenate dehydratase